MECILLEKTHFSELQHFAAILNEVQSGDIEASPRDCGFLLLTPQLNPLLFMFLILDLILTLFPTSCQKHSLDGKLCT